MQQCSSWNGIFAGGTFTHTAERLADKLLETLRKLLDFEQDLVMQDSRFRIQDGENSGIFCLQQLQFCLREGRSV